MAENIGRESDKFMLRLPEGMRDRIKASADNNNRSMNAEIVSALEEKYPAVTFTAEDFLSLLEQITSSQSMEDQNENEYMLNQTLQHLNFDFSATIVDGAVSFIRNSYPEMR